MAEELSLDRASYQRLIQTGKEEAARKAKHNREFIAQSRVKAEHLLGDPNWDLYLSVLRSNYESASNLADTWTHKLDQASSQDAIMEAKLGLRECLSLMLAWKTAMELPGDIIRKAKKQETDASTHR